VDELVASKLRELLKSTMSKKHAKEYFNEPVNWQKLKLFTYLQFIKSPKALGQVLLTLDDDAKRTFESKTYQCTQEFAHDVRLVGGPACAGHYRVAGLWDAWRCQ